MARRPRPADPSAEIPTIDDATWAIIGPEAESSRKGRMGRPTSDLRRVLEGILYKQATGVSWEQVPDRYGTRSTLHDWSVRWEQSGLLDRVRILIRDRDGARRPLP
jgi:transposase